jgi:hypothetical protein
MHLTILTYYFFLYSADGKAHLRRLALRFFHEFSGGVLLEAASKKGTLKPIYFTVTYTHFIWEAHKDQQEPSAGSKTALISDIGCVRTGMARHLSTVFPDEAMENRAFHIILKSRSMAATFLAPSPQKKDEIMNGIHAIFELI